MSALFAPGAARLYTIAPGANFLDELARTLARETGLTDDPEALADALVYVPNSRSKSALALALTRASARGACLLPDIRALGDLETDEPPPSAETALADLPPVMPNAERIGQLTRLVMAYYERSGLAIPAASALSAARELARLLDQAALSGEIEWEKLRTLVPEGELSRHWQDSLRFLEIITQQWPAKLAEATAMDPYARRYAAALALTEAWRASPPQGPVIIAGSTGATPASRLLMQAALDLPNGLVILPGLDRDMPPEAWKEVSQAPSHPQFTLARTLASLGKARGDVASWPGAETQASHANARRRLIHEALAPADRTADWTDRLAAMAPNADTARFVCEALRGLSLVETTDDTDEALAAALLLRETLETPDQTAALVTPDAGLARHVSALLRQWDVQVAPSAGQSLLQTPAGSFACLVMEWLADLSHPVRMMAVFNHELCRFDPALRGVLDRHFLRGPRVWDSLDSLVEHLETASEPERRKYTSYTDQDIADALNILDQARAALATTGLHDSDDTPLPGPDYFTRAAQLMQAVADPPAPWRGEDGASLSSFLRELADMTAPLGPQAPDLFLEVFKAEAALASVQLANPHPRLAIWGPLEARLQSADRLILAGLNEGIWPAQPAADAFLPRAFRQAIGLSDPDERIGLSAHDFAQLAAAPNVTLITARRRDNKPAVASRWIWRLRTLARGALQDDAETILAPSPAADPRTWMAALETAPPLPEGFSAEPRPTPPVEARPKSLSVTRIETLVRDPYAIYCQYVLRLNKLDPLNLPGDVRIRGTAIHKALERLEEDGQNKSVDGLLALLEEELRRSGEAEADIIALREKRREAAHDYLVWRADNQHQIEGRPITEEKGEITLQIGGEPFRLHGTADRIERRTGGQVAILDFKTGKPPSENQVRSGLSPQMPLQGLIARNGGYPGLGNHVSVAALTYLQIGTKFTVQEIGRPGKKDEIAIEDLIDQTEQELIGLLTRFAQPDHPYLSAPRPERVTYPSDYTRLARRDEWTSLATYDEVQD